ncbi:MAG: pentapeptide repeat-containing protein [Cyanobacteriota bacterium]|nr:pentapeptide repeat-containing protein [Cyanobacteriota bacterium]
MANANLMANAEHLNLLERGVDVWNQWRARYKKIRPDLRGVDLRGIDLRQANLSHAILFKANLFGADLRGVKLNHAVLFDTNFSRANLIQASLTSTDLFGANLCGAKLRRANLKKADLTEADLTEADLTGASLIDAQAISANFEGATLTGACVADWNINDTTNLNGVTCDWIYLDSIASEEGKINFVERRPKDIQQQFAIGELAALFQVSLETVDLIFEYGIEWLAFLDTFQQLERDINNQDLAIQAIENRGRSNLVVRLEIPVECSRQEIQSYFYKEYNLRLKAIERATQKQPSNSENDRLEERLRKSANLLEITRILARYQHS